MKRLVAFFLLSFVSTATWAIEVNLTYKPDYKQPILKKMTCEGRSCSCSEDTELDEETMKCRKCDDGLSFDPKKRLCYDDKQVRNETAVFDSEFKAKLMPKIRELDVADPDTCDYKSHSNGKFASCACAPQKLSFGLGTSPNMQITIKRKFNPELQKCERNEAYQLSVANRSCFGPREGAFDNLSAIGLDVIYEGDRASLGSCGYQVGSHVITVADDTKLSSIVDAVSFILKPSDYLNGKKIESYEIIQSSLNY